MTSVRQRTSAWPGLHAGRPTASFRPGLFWLLCWLSILSKVAGHTIDIASASKECFFEDLHSEDQMTVTYQVGGGGHLDIDFWLTDPSNAPMFTQERKDTGTYSFTAQKESVASFVNRDRSKSELTTSGRYTYCFSNEMSSVTAKTVSFNVHGILYVDDDGHTAPIEKEIRALSAALETVKDEQEYIVVRERIHRDTAESTNDRVKWWSILQTFLLVGVCAFQIMYMRRIFESKSMNQGRLM